MLPAWKDFRSSNPKSHFRGAPCRLPDWNDLQAFRDFLNAIIVTLTMTT